MYVTLLDDMTWTGEWLMQGGEGEGAQSSGLDAEENMGISSPLYQIIDVVFDLRARGFLRRQVCNPSTPLAHLLCLLH